MQMKKWLDQMENEKHKYSRLFLPDETKDNEDMALVEYIEEQDPEVLVYVAGFKVAPLRHWVQIG
jgi:hypothetical protein